MLSKRTNDVLKKDQPLQLIIQWTQQWTQMKKNIEKGTEKYRNSEKKWRRWIYPFFFNIGLNKNFYYLIDDNWWIVCFLSRN